MEKSFLKDDQAISEEFTSLPSLSLIMIGVLLFFLLVSTAYDSHDHQTSQLSHIDIATYVLTQTLDPEQIYMLDAHRVDIQTLQSLDATSHLQDIQKSLSSSGLNFTLSVVWKDTTQWILSEPPGFRQTAVSKQIGIAINPLETIPGTVTVILWEDL